MNDKENTQCPQEIISDMSAQKCGVMNSMTDEINGCSKLLTGFQDKDNTINAAMDSQDIKELIENKEAKNLGDDVCYSNELKDTSDECTRKSELSNASKGNDVTSMNAKEVIERDCPDVISDCRALENSTVDRDDATELQNSNHSLRNESKLESSEEHLQKDHLQIPNMLVNCVEDENIAASVPLNGCVKEINGQPNDLVINNANKPVNKELEHVKKTESDLIPESCPPYHDFKSHEPISSQAVEVTKNQPLEKSPSQIKNGLYLERKYVSKDNGKTKDLSEKTDYIINKNDLLDDDEDPDTICGIGHFRPKWLQPWATPKVFLSLYSILGVVSGAYYAYRVGALTTLEKRFAFDSQTSGTIMMVDEITPVLLGPFIGYFGGKTHRPRMFGLGMLISTLCCFVSALPYFLYGPSPHLNIANVKNGTTFEMCDDVARKENCNADDRPPTIAAVLLLMFAGFLKGFGNLAYHSIGLSYMDDISKKKNTPVYFAVSFSLRLMGPMIGFVMSYYFLKIYENPLDNPGYGPEDPRWIGAWWIGFLLQGILLLMFSLPLALFPRRLRGQKRLPDSDKKRGGSFTGLAAALKRLAKNPLYIAIVINTLMGIFGSVGHFVMLPKYMEHQFRLSASDANLLSGPPGIAAIMLSTILGGYLIWKFKPSTKFLIGAMVLLEAIGAVGYLILMIPKCEKIQMHNFGMDDNGLILDGGCNFNCNCTTKTFSPVCGSDGKTVYFSPCYAGCQESSNKTFSECSCIADSDANNHYYAKEGFCVSEDCWSQTLGYVITLPILQFITSLLRIQYTIVLLRSISPEDKSVALGTFESLVCIFGFVPYMIIIGALVDSTCLVWEKSCGETGNCWFYEMDQFNNILHAVSAGFTGLSAVTLMATYFLSHHIRDLYEEDEDIEGTVVNHKEIEATKGDLEMNSLTKL